MSAAGLSGRWLAAALPAVTIVTALVVGVAVGVEVSLLVVAAGALTGVIALLWASVQSLTGESPITLEEAMTLGAPSLEEEQKRSVLRALKDLEFERSVGKISEDDYAELSARYRAEAKRLMQLVDEGAQPDRERVEKAVRERLAKAPVKPVDAGKDAPDDQEPADDERPPESAEHAPSSRSPNEVAASDTPSSVPSSAESEDAS